MTVHQQQQIPAPPPTVTQQARHAFNLYRECVDAGLWARLVLERLPTGENIRFFSSPMAAAPAAARWQKNNPPRKRRRPNKKRTEKKKLWRQDRATRQAATYSGPQQPSAGHAERQRQQELPSSQQLLQMPSGSEPQLTAECGNTQQQQRQAAAAVLGTYAQIAACPPVPTPASAAATPEAAATASGSPAFSPRLTRAKKRRKQASPGDTAIVQLDGAHATPPSSPPEPPEPLSPEVVGVGSPTAPTPPPLHPPPWHVGSPTAPTCPSPDAVDATAVPPPSRRPVKSSLEICKHCKTRKHLPGQRACICCSSDGY